MNEESETQDAQVSEEPVEKKVPETQESQEVNPEEEKPEKPEAAESEKSEEEKSEKEKSEDILIEEEEDSKSSSAPDWVRNLRKSYKDAKKENRKLQEELKSLKTSPEEEKSTIRKRPTLEEFDFDEEKYYKAYENWFEAKKRCESEEAALLEERKKANEEIQGKILEYEKLKESLHLSDFEDYENVVMDALSESQQAVILQHSKNPALVVYALGKNPAEAEKLGREKDLISFSRELFSLEQRIKFNRKPSGNVPPPEKMISGGGASRAASDTLDALRAEAEQTGDHSKVVAFLRNQELKTPVN